MGGRKKKFRSRCGDSKLYFFFGEQANEEEDGVVVGGVARTVERVGCRGVRGWRKQNNFLG